MDGLHNAVPMNILYVKCITKDGKCCPVTECSLGSILSPKSNTKLLQPLRSSIFFFFCSPKILNPVNVRKIILNLFLITSFLHFIFKTEYLLLALVNSKVQ